jgi:hypothetical protein
VSNTLHSFILHVKVSRAPAARSSGHRVHVKTRRLWVRSRWGERFFRTCTFFVANASISTFNTQTMHIRYWNLYVHCNAVVYNFFLLILFGSITLLTRMTSISLHMQMPVTYQSHGSVSQREQLFFSLRIKLHALLFIT